MAIHGEYAWLTYTPIFFLSTSGEDSITQIQTYNGQYIGIHMYADSESHEFPNMKVTITKFQIQFHVLILQKLSEI